MQLEPVRQGDIVDVVAPASQFPKADLRRAERELRELGLNPRIPKNIFASHPIYANTDEQRLAQLKKAIYDRKSKVIWCARGGYGAIRLMREIEKWPKPKTPKIFIGYSDITTLHTHLNQKWGWPTLHGPMIDRLGQKRMARAERRQLLGLIFGLIGETEFQNLKSLNKAARIDKKTKGTIVGGNLAVLQSGLATPSQIKTHGRILFLEDIGERPHRVDRMLTQMDQAGLFKKVKAVVFGRFLLQQAVDRRVLWNDVLSNFAQDLRVPVFGGLKVGHDPKLQYTLPFNTLATLHGGRKPSLVVASGIKPR